MCLKNLHYNPKNSREIYLEIGIDGIIKNISSNCVRIFGYKHEFMIGQLISNFTSEPLDIHLFKPNDATNKLCISFKKLSGELMHMDIEYELQRTDGHLAQINLSLIDVTKYLKEEQKLKSLLHVFEKSNDIIYSLNIKPTFEFIYLSPAIEKKLGYTLEENYKNPYIACECVHKDYFDIHMKKLTGDMDYTKQVITKYQHKITGEYIWYEDYVIPTYNELGEVVRIDGICRDINERIKLEEKLTYFSYHDSLTDLYNRTYFEKVSKELNDKPDSSIFLIIGDLDNLKKINDKLGHEQGDQLIKNTSKMLKGIFKKHLVFRIGGDEFAIIVADLDYEQVQDKILRFKNEVTRYNKTNPKIPIKISLGFSYCEQSLGAVNRLFKIADENMYKDKLINRANEI